MPAIKIEKLTKYYHREQKFPFIGKKNREIGAENINLNIQQGEFVFVIGSCGAGKTTLLNLISGRTRPSKGGVWIGKKRVRKRPLSKKISMPMTVGYVPQQRSLVHGMTIRKNMEAAAKIGIRKFDDRYEYDLRIDKVLGLTGLSSVADRYPLELTHGQQRKAELARALINNPSILILDDITANLDPDSMWDIFLLLNEINRMGITIVMATHSSNYVNIARKRVITLVCGRVYSDEAKGRYGSVNSRKIATKEKLERRIFDPEKEQSFK